MMALMNKLIKARVYRSAKREFLVKCLETGEFLTSCAMGNLLKHEENIVVGDYVEIEATDGSQGTHIVSVAPRANEIYRMIIREGKKKVIASNCDLLVILSSCSRPEFKRGIVDRYLARAHQWGIKTAIVFNKMDEYDASLFSDGLQFECDRLKNLGVETFEISALDPNYKLQFLPRGIEELKSALKGRTAILVGQSGVGKSKTISALCGGNVELKTHAVSKVGKGSHTTTWAEIVDWGDFTMIDSPGVRSFSLDDIPQDQLLSFFPDIEELATCCKFSNCKHEDNSKGCAFWADRDLDSYETRLIHSRLESFKRINEEVCSIPQWQKK